MLLYILYAIGAVVALGLGMAASKPNVFRLERSAIMKAPREQIAANISDFHKWTAWSPWEKIDPNLQRTYSGPERGKGAKYGWVGNKKVGTGAMEILDESPEKITIKLDFLAPWEAHNITEFTMVPQGAATNVMWAMHGPSPFQARVFGLFFNMEKMVGTDFQKGLDSLQQIVEQPAGV